MKILFFMMMSFSFVGISNAQNEDFVTQRIEALAKRMLIPQLDVTSSDKAVWNEYISRIDQGTWDEKSQDKNFMGDLNASLKKIGVNLKIGSNYASFEKAREKYKEEISFVSDTRQTDIIFKKYLTKDQLDRFYDALPTVLNQGGLFVREIATSTESVSLRIIWCHPPGPSIKAVVKSATISGGSRQGRPVGELFPSGYELSVGSEDVTIGRDENKELRVNINVPGYSASFTLPSEQRMSLSAASPIGTIVASMLPPEKYSDVTNDKANWFARKAKWVPADGRSVVGSKYAGLISPDVPDLRGQFLRGLNSFENSRKRSDGKEDPEGNTRRAGEYQEDQLKSHSHSFSDHIRKSDHGKGRGSDSQGWEKYHNGGNFLKINASGGSETRPKNIAVFYYIRIN